MEKPNPILTNANAVLGKVTTDFMMLQVEHAELQQELAVARADSICCAISSGDASTPLANSSDDSTARASATRRRRTKGRTGSGDAVLGCMSYQQLNSVFIYQAIKNLARPLVSIPDRATLGPMSLSPRAAATRRTILDAARTCFAERGLHGTTTRAIAERAGVTQPLIHHYFGTKEGLVAAVLDATMSEYELAQADQWALPLGDLKFFSVGLTVLFRWLGEQREPMRLSSWARLEGWEVHNPAMLAVFEKVRERLRHAQDVGMLRPEVDVDIAILMIDALFKGFWDRHESYAIYPVNVEDLPERVLEQSVRLLLVGLLVPEVAEQVLAQVQAQGNPQAGESA